VTAVERGVTAAFGSGVVYGLSRAGHRVELVDAGVSSEHLDADSLPGRGRDGFSTPPVARPARFLLEPIMAVDVLCPLSSSARLIGNLNARQGLILHVDEQAGRGPREGPVSPCSMFGYSTALRSATQGRATFTMEFSHFAEKVGGFGESR